MAGDAVAICCLELLYTLLVLIECEPSRHDVEKKPKKKREKELLAEKSRLLTVLHGVYWNPPPLIALAGL